MAAIVMDEVKLSMDWGRPFGDYSVGMSPPIDLQDFMVEIAAKRATSVEGEVIPLTTRIKTDNAISSFCFFSVALLFMQSMQISFASISL